MVSYSPAGQAYILLEYKGRAAKTVADEPRPMDERKSIVEKILKFVFSVDTIDEQTLNSILEAEDKISQLTDEQTESTSITFPMSQVGFTEGSDENMSSRWIQALEEHRSLIGDIDTITLQMRRSHVALLHNIFGSTPLIDKHLLQTLFAWVITYDLYGLSGFLDSARQPHTVRVWCYESAKRTFPSVATLKALHEIVNQSRVDAVREMADYIFKEIAASFKTSQWLDNPTREAVLKKLSLTSRIIGYPFNLSSGEAVDRYLEPMQDLTPDNYAKNVVLTRQGRARIFWKRFRQQDGYINAINTVLDLIGVNQFVNAFNLAQYNAIVIPAPFMYAPFFIFHGPPEVNYAGLGTTIGHEIMHNYDNERMFSDNSTEGVTKNSLAAYKKLVGCLQSVIHKAPRARTFEEREKEYLADALGIQSVERAWRKAAESTSVTLGYVRGFTRDQLFYVSYAIKWCGIPSLNVFKTHPDLDERCNVQLMNSDHFSRVFNCPPGSPMNPSEKCRFW
ncbi:neprilysin-1-like [Ornithodoros turicata]|uniref:neprilysin-1-like n=1 Tax=Ornithodoros turicata TaxID=34597 RepID=UPI003138ED63